MTDSNATYAKIQMDLLIAAAPVKVWQALTENIGHWWPEDFFAGGEAGQREFFLEPHPGGRMYEQWADGGGLLWGTVTTVEPGKKLQILGHIFPDWGGPSQWYGSWTLTAEADGTRLHFSESALGRVTDDGMKEKDTGWQFLWTALKAHLEGEPAPIWSD